jgi:small conductance mechanosensitive channel
MNEHVESLNQVKTTVIDLAIKFGPKVFVAIMIIVAGVFVGRWVGKATARGLRKFDVEPPVRVRIARSSAKYCTTTALSGRWTSR